MVFLKECITCNSTFELSNFSRNKNNPDGLQNECKKCNKIKHDIKYRKKNNLPNLIYNTQVSSSNKRGHPLPSYTKSELKEWLYSNQRYHILYNEWKNSGFVKELKPSVDRIDDNIGYSFENIQLMTWGDNKKKSHYCSSIGTLKSGTGCKKIYQYSNDMQLIGCYHSAKEAHIQTGINYGNIKASANPNIDTYRAGGFIWSYKVL